VSTLPDPAAGESSQLLAHSPTDGGEWHYLADHLQGTADQAARFGAVFHSEAACWLFALLHDIGKADPDWQKYLEVVARGGTASKLDHKHAGAILLKDWGLANLTFPIAGHHGGMPNYQTLQENLANKTAGQKAAIDWATEHFGLLQPDRASLLPRRFLPTGKADHAGYRRMELWLRMVFSTLVDADWLDTTEHFRPGNRPAVATPEIQNLLDRYEHKRTAVVSDRKNDPVTAARVGLFNEVMSHAESAPGWFELTAPTGSGKTLTALSFALRHATANGLRRIITAVPFISVTQQTAAEYRGVLELDGSEPAVVEHHSSPSGGKRSSARDQLWERLSTENWDAPVIVTTMVQLLDSLFDNRPTTARKLHNIAGSVLILDEVQTLPWRLLDPTLDVLRELVRSFGCSVVFCTATQPPFDKVGSVEGITRTQLCGTHWFPQFDRVDVEVDLEPLSWESFANRVLDAARDNDEQCLVVLNTIKDARALTKQLTDHPGVLYLSSRTCPKHRERVLSEVKQRLREGLPCILVSTQLVEAGIDIDFPIAVRAVGPLPAIAQVAGRVNRHGCRARGKLIVLNPGDGGVPRNEYELGRDITISLLRGGKADPLDPQTIDTYYDRLIALTTDKFDIHGIQNQRESFNFATVAAKYRVIADDSTPVLVLYGRFDPLNITIPADPRARRALHRKLQPYTVALPDRELAIHQNNIRDLGGGFLAWTGDYDQELFGLLGDQDTEGKIW
jgi:CRISPR-associated endonuclease/helicase Cas3